MHSGCQMELSGADIQQTAGLLSDGWVLGLHLCLEVTVFLAPSSQGSMMWGHWTVRGESPEDPSEAHPSGKSRQFISLGSDALSRSTSDVLCNKVNGLLRLGAAAEFSWSRC